MGATMLPCPQLSVWLRLYVYGLHGYFTEVMFTAVWEFVLHQNWALPGCTSVWSLFIYAVGDLAIEKFYRKYHSSVPLLLRGFIYLCWTYAWEFACGLLLRQFNACPWDYSERSFNLLGLITLEYAPAWFLASMLTEQLLIHYLLFASFTSPPVSPSDSCITNGFAKDHYSYKTR